MASGDAGSMHRYLSYVGWKPIPSGIPGTYFARVHELGTLTCARRNSTSWHALVLKRKPFLEKTEIFNKLAV